MAKEREMQYLKELVLILSLLLSWPVQDPLRRI